MKPVKVASGADLLHLMDEMTENAPVLLERHGVIFQLRRVDDNLERDDAPDAETVRQVLAETAGSWADLDVDALVGDVHDARQAGTRSSDRP